MKVKQLEKTITKMADDFEGEAGINVQLLPGGEVIGINDCQVFPLASVFKIPILVEFLSQCEEGHCDMTERIDLKSSSFTPGSGVLRFMDPGLQPTWKDLATLMIIVSDNTATDLVFERVGASQIDEKAKSLGMQNTSINADCANVIGIAAGYERQRIEKIGPQISWKNCKRIMRRWTPRG